MSVGTPLSTLDVLFNSDPEGKSLNLPIESSASALVQMLRQVADEQVAHETEKDSPWTLVTSDSTKTRVRKGALRTRRVDDLTFQNAVRLEHVVTAAQVAIAMQIEEAQGLDVDGQYEELEERLADIMPEDTASSGSARQIAAFVTRTSRTWLENGIPAGDIAACNRPRMARMLADVSSAANKVERAATLFIKGEEVVVTPEIRREEHRWICDTARQVAQGQDFMVAAKTRYHDPKEPPAPRIRYDTTSAPNGTEVRLGAAMTPDLWTLVKSRLGNRLERAEPGTLYVPISPHKVESALGGRGQLWRKAGQELMRIAMLSSLSRSTALGILEANEGKWIDLDFALTAAQGRVSQIDMREALNELCILHSDGIYPFAQTKHLEGEKQQWKLL